MKSFFAEEKHAELCYTECLLLDALLTFIQVIVNNKYCALLTS